MAELNRRQFVIAAACAAGACLACGGGEALADDAGVGGAQIDVGTMADYPKDGSYDKLATSKKILIGRENGKLFAMSSFCTHRNGIVKLDNGELVCPKHHSHFDTDGKPTSGPAKAALFRHGISLNSDGHIIVDTTKKLGENQWSDPAASIAAT